MSAVIKVNGTVIPDSLVIVDTLSNEVTLETLLDNGKKLNKEVHVEVHIFGDIDFWMGLSRTQFLLRVFGLNFCFDSTLEMWQ